MKADLLIFIHPKDETAGDPVAGGSRDPTATSCRAPVYPSCERSRGFHRHSKKA